MIIVIHGPAGSGKTTVCKLLVKNYFLNRAVYYDIDHVTQTGTQLKRCQQIIEMIGSHQYLCSDFHYFINWVFETPQVALDLMCKLSFLNAQQEVRGIIINSNHEVRMKRLANRPDRERAQEQSRMAAKNIEENLEAWAEMGPTIDTSDVPEEKVAKKIITLLKLS